MRALALALLAAAGCDARAGGQPAPAASVQAPPARKPAGFLKGQLHAHTGNSGDSDTDPAEAAAWYAARGYDFVVFTDHNVVTELPAPAGLLLLRGVELTQNLPTCEPAPEPGEHCLLHVSALFVAPQRDPVRFGWPSSFRRADLYARAVDRAAAMGGLAQLDHPNFHHGADLGILLGLAARGVTLLEVENAAVDSDNEGDARHPSTEALWDAALDKGARIFGTATDDAHHYGDAARVRASGHVAYTGDRGFVMVQADKTPEGIRAAIAAGAFYATTGVILERVVLGREAIEVDVAPESGACTLEVIAGGRVVETVRGASLRFDPRRPGVRWARVRVTDASGRKALTQPVWP
jgi:hypothetical protein